MEYVALGVTLLAIAGQTYSSVQAAESQAKAYESEEKAREVEAESMRQAAAYEEQQYRYRTAIAASKGRAIGAAAGLDISFGSPLFMDIENARQREIEALNIRRTGEVSASGKLYEARMAGYGARATRAGVPGIVMGGVAQAGGTVLGYWARGRGSSGGGGGGGGGSSSPGYSSYRAGERSS